MRILRPDDGPEDLGAAGFGRIPALDGDIATSIPDPVLGVSETQTQLSQTSSTQAVQQAIVIPPAPYAVINRIDPSGALTIWFQTLIRKLGGYASTPSDDAQIMALEGGTLDPVARQLIQDLQVEMAMLPVPVPATGSAGASWTEVEIDFGSAPTYSKSFTVTDGSVNAGSKIAVVPCGKVATGGSEDDWEWDGITFAANPGAGVFSLIAAAFPGPVIGKRKISYQVA